MDELVDVVEDDDAVVEGEVDGGQPAVVGGGLGEGELVGLPVADGVVGRVPDPAAEEGPGELVAGAGGGRDEEAEAAGDGAGDEEGVVLVLVVLEGLLEVGAEAVVDDLDVVGLVAIGAASGAVVFGMRAQKAQQAAASPQTPAPKENKDDAVSFSATKGKPVDVPVATVEAKPELRESITYNDVEILRALAEESFVYGNLAALCDKTGLGREFVSQRLTVLKSFGVIETRINEKNVLHWFVSARGKQLLGEILEGQEEKKTA